MPKILLKEVLLSWAEVVKSTSKQTEKQFKNELLWDNANNQIFLSIFF